MPVSTSGPLGWSRALQSVVKLGGDTPRFEVNTKIPCTPGVPGQALVFKLWPDPKNRYWFGPSFTPPITPSTGPNLNPSWERAPRGRTTTPGETAIATSGGDDEVGSAFPAMPSTMAMARPNTCLRILIVPPAIGGFVAQPLHRVAATSPPRGGAVGAEIIAAL